MSEHDPDAINRLIGEFVDLQEVWEKNPQAFDWLPLQALAQKGAHAYNEGAGPSFHALALDGVWHSEYHERFLAYSLHAGFDPFKLAQAGTATAEIPVIDHELLSEAAWSNPSSARMRALLMEVARVRFEPLAQEIEQGGPGALERWFRMVEACAESIPLDLLERVAPELAREHHAQQAREERVDPVEGYLCSAEVIVDSRSQPYG
ncbi:MAG TPA: hypothetical protein VF427_06800 [Noviherbaspirillum sp.]